MNYDDINIEHIKSNKSFIKYYTDKLYLRTPRLKCYKGVEHYFNKYVIKLELDEDFYRFIRLLEKRLKSFCDENSTYKSQISYINSKPYLTLKLPYRSGKHMVNIDSQRIYLPTMKDIQENTEIECTILVTKVWNFMAKDANPPYMASGCLMEVTDITIY